MINIKKIDLNLSLKIIIKFQIKELLIYYKCFKKYNY